MIQLAFVNNAAFHRSLDFMCATHTDIEKLFLTTFIIIPTAAAVKLLPHAPHRHPAAWHIVEWKPCRECPFGHPDTETPPPKTSARVEDNRVDEARTAAHQEQASVKPIT